VSDKARRLASDVRAVLLRVLGVPDYECYVTHLRAAHPDRVPLGREDFMASRLEARYCKPGARCC
jgi:uncharacterized short protein YbdD (DUF466 family)